tara:strand:- start:15 stop:755 length:741 start_codon:yes stop_codon:yes gene_type:complete
MSNAFRAFGSPREKYSSSDQINKKKCKTIYNDILNKTKYPNCKKQKNIYINPVTKCLIGAQNYNDLLNVTKGYYFEKKPNLKNVKQSEIWSGQYLYFDTDGLCMIDAAPNANECNRFKYPSNQDNSPSHYPLPLPITKYYPNVSNNSSFKTTNNENPTFISHNTLVVDPSYNVFYSQKNDYESSCNTYKQLDYLNHVYIVDEDKLQNKYLFYQDQKLSNQLNGFSYPKKFKFKCMTDNYTNSNEKS